ncbi:MAG: PD-(D/E)XK nuclease family protein [Kiritimatiellaceae bacterium]|nr:PD-(D/E)XK nuclease family protein [Kiritimatiellaceae bacterium]
MLLTAMSTARERLTLSYTHTDSDGKERLPGEFFERIRRLTQVDQPAQGDSFHTILPPAACWAEDEVRQTRAYYSKPISGSGESPPPPKLDLQAWLMNHPEFSPTALECLARNRFVFFLEKVLKINPDLTHEDELAAMDRGTIIHDILEKVYTTIARQSGYYATRNSGEWKLAQQGEIPLAVLKPEKSEELLALARQTAEEEFSLTERRSSRHLGHPAVWQIEKQKILKIIENFIQMDLDTAHLENRYPALFELKFDARHDLPVRLTRDGEEIQLKGKVDRIDLIFNSDGTLASMLVIDYKSPSRGVSIDTLEKEIALNLDCQLPLYTFVAQERFFGAHNTPELNAITAAVYHVQERDLTKMTNQFKKRRLTMHSPLVDSFLDTLFSNVRKLREGDLATEPLIAHFEEYSHICRTSAIDPKELMSSADD